jgi:hypothetical protein
MSKETFEHNDLDNLIEVLKESVPTGVYTVVEKRGGEETLHYILKDNLGSWTTVTDSEGNVEQRLSYDAWGSLRDPDTWSGSFTGKPMFDRGPLKQVVINEHSGFMLPEVISTI